MKLNQQTILIGIIIIVVILYLISPIDLIPDIIPIIGLIDDVGVGLLGAWAIGFVKRKGGR